MNAYYDLKNYECFLDKYLNKYFNVSMTSHRSDSSFEIGDIADSGISNGTKYTGDVFLEHLKAHYKRT